MIQKNGQVQLLIDNQEQDSFNQLKPNYQNSSIINLNNGDLVPIKGQCQQFISKNQMNSRQLSIYQIPTPQHQNWEPMACHFRNIQYNNQHVRKPQTLKSCFDLICESYLPYYKSIYNNQDQRKKFELFLYDRVRSIRCQYFVQAVFQPNIYIRIVRLILFLEISIGQPVTLSGLEQFLKDQVRQMLLSDQKLKGYYFQALQYAIFWQKKARLSQLIDYHFDQIEQSPRLVQCLGKKLKIINNNYYIYLFELSKNKNIYTRLILWSQMKPMRQIIMTHYKKAKMNQRAAFLCRILGYSKLDGWLNISKQQDYEKLQKSKQQFDLQIKLWVKQSDLLSALDKII